MPDQDQKTSVTLSRIVSLRGVAYGPGTIEVSPVVATVLINQHGAVPATDGDFAASTRSVDDLTTEELRAKLAEREGSTVPLPTGPGLPPPATMGPEFEQGQQTQQGQSGTEGQQGTQTEGGATSDYPEGFPLVQDLQAAGITYQQLRDGAELPDVFTQAEQDKIRAELALQE